MTVSIVLPCFNPPPGWEQSVHSSYLSFCDKTQQQAEVIVVIDGISKTVTTDSLLFLEQNIPLFRLIQYPENKGKGYAIRQGVAVAKGDLLIYTDIDFPYTVESVVNIYNGLKKNEFDVGVGVKNEAYYAHVPAARKLISRFLRFFIGLFLSMPITDTQCGLKGFNSAVKPLFLKTTINRYLFDLEFIRNCFIGKQFRVKAIPIELNENVQFRKMNYRILLSESINFIRLLFRKAK